MAKNWCSDTQFDCSSMFSSGTAASNVLVPGSCSAYSTISSEDISATHELAAIVAAELGMEVDIDKGAGAFGDKVARAASLEMVPMLECPSGVLSRAGTAFVLSWVVDSWVVDAGDGTALVDSRT